MEIARQFERDDLIGQIFESYSDECITLAKTFGLSLDYSEASVSLIEKLAGMFHSQMPPQGLAENRLESLQKVLGSHVAQVLIGSRGGLPGVTRIGDLQVPAVQVPSGDVLWPWAQVRRRLLEGAGENVWQHYCNVVASSMRRAAMASSMPPPPPTVPTMAALAPQPA